MNTSTTASPQRGFSVQDPDLKQSIKSLMTPSTFASLLAYVLDWLIIIGAACISWSIFMLTGVDSYSSLAYLLACVLIASRQKGFDNLIHEASHYNLSSNKKINDFMCYWLGAMWLHPGLTLEEERNDHIKGHHAFFWDPARDPKNKRHHSLGLSKLPKSSVFEVVKIFSGAFLRFYWWRLHAILSGKLLRSAFSNKGSLARGLVVFGVFALLTYAGVLLPLILYWLIPALLVLPVISFVAQMTEHAGTEGASEFEMTRNKLGFFQGRLFHPHGDGYHIVHHLYPGIPHHNLAKAHALLMRDPIYKTGNHCYGLALTTNNRKTVLSTLIR